MICRFLDLREWTKLMCVMLRILIPCVVCALCGGGGGAGCVSSESKRVPNVHTVVPGVLIRGGQPDERGLRELRDTYGIDTVVNFNHVTNDSEAQTAERLGLNYLPLRDNPYRDDGDREMVLAFLKVVRDRERNGTVFAHCKTGMDRVGAAVAAYRVVECGWDADRALDEVRRHQDFGHTVFFQFVPRLVREIERDRCKWIARLEEMPDPPVRRADQR